MKKLFVLIAAACMTCTAAFAQTVKPFKEGERAVFLGNSITDATVSFIRSRYPNSLEQELDFLKLNVKFSLLISDNAANYEVWNISFPEANRSIWKNAKQPFRNRLLQWSASHRYYWIVRGYYNILFKFVYGVLYR